MSQTPPDPDAVRQTLEAALADCRTASTATADDRKPVELDQTSVGRLTRMDAMQRQAMAQATERQRQTQMARLTAALERLDAGDYGYCTSCGEPIPEPTPRHRSRGADLRWLHARRVTLLALHRDFGLVVVWAVSLHDSSTPTLFGSQVFRRTHRPNFRSLLLTLIPIFNDTDSHLFLSRSILVMGSGTGPRRKRCRQLLGCDRIGMWNGSRLLLAPARTPSSIAV